MENNNTEIIVVNNHSGNLKYADSLLDNNTAYIVVHVRCKSTKYKNKLQFTMAAKICLKAAKTNLNATNEALATSNISASDRYVSLKQIRIIKTSIAIQLYL